MKKANVDDEFLKRLEDLLNDLLDEIDVSKVMPVSVDISINFCPLMISNPEEPVVHRVRKTPVDIIETEKKVHVIIGLQGMDEETVKLSCNGLALEVMANNTEKSLIEIIDLPARVNKTGMKASYEKGILEVVFNKSKKRTSSKSNA